MSSTVVDTPWGRVRGVRAEGVSAFLGIRYAARPDGRRRFRPPDPPTPWAGVLDCAAPGARCPQMQFPSDGLELVGEPLGEPASEDCLFVNVWTPAADGGKRPVLVYFHGGGFLQGSGAAPVYNGAALVRRGDVVVVTVNHRLGILGHLHLDDLYGDDYRGSGNAGSLDLVASLEWVRDSIAAFGGDPASVTICGQSGGGWKVCTLLGMPAARGLFGAAIVMSGAKLFANGASDATDLAAAALQHIGVDRNQPDQLALVEVERLIAAQDVAAIGGAADFSPVVDGATLPLHPIAAVAAGRVPDVAMLIGSTAHEHSRMLHLFGADLSSFCTDDADVERRLAQQLGEASPGIIAAYRGARPGASATDLYVAIATDQWMRIPSIVLAERKVSAGRAPVFMYLFAWESPLMGGLLRATHGTDLPFVFDNVDAATATGRAPARHRLAAEMSEAWLAFAHQRHPGHELLPPWPGYTVEHRSTMIFSDTCLVVDDPAAVERRAWEAVETDRLGLLAMPM